MLIGASILSVTSDVAIGSQTEYWGIDLSNHSRSGNVVLAHELAGIIEAVDDDVPIPALRHAGAMRGHFSKPKKLQFSADLLD